MRSTRALGVPAALALALLQAACSSANGSTEADAGAARDGAISTTPIGNPDGGSATPCPEGQSLCGGTCIGTTTDDANCGGCGVTCSGGEHCAAGSCQPSKIQHVVLIVQENHTFDAYFGRYCKAPAGSQPTCTTGPQCCEGAPATDPSGAMPMTLDDDPNNAAANFATDRDHDQACELQEIDDGKMDQYVTGATATGCAGATCSHDYNFALADGSSPSGAVAYYWSLAAGGALADRWFQPIAGGSASNDMYFAGARFRFVDNATIPKFAAGETTASPPGTCADEYDPFSCLAAPQAVYTDGNIASLLLDAGRTFAVYSDGYAESAAAAPGCPSRTAVSECPYSDCIAHPEACNGCIFDPSDIPFTYFGDFNDASSKYFADIEDYGALQTDLAAGKLPSFAFVKGRLFHNEHPNYSTIADGVAFVQATVQMIEQSPYASSTLVLLTWDEGGGFYDHVAPPPAVPTTVDQDDAGNAVPYGTRVPLLAIGPFARKGTVSHVTMEHSSIIRFLEYVFLGPVGQLHARDAVVANIGSLLDPSATGIPIPEQ